MISPFWIARVPHDVVFPLPHRGTAPSNRGLELGSPGLSPPRRIAVVSLLDSGLRKKLDKLTLPSSNADRRYQHVADP